MIQRILRSLALAATLVLLLPQGWCCLFAASSSAPRVETRCCCCSHPARQQAPAPHRPCRQCPCADRQTVLLSATTAKHIDAGALLVALAPPAVVLVADAGVLKQSGPLIYPLAHRLHVFDCVWLC